MNTSQHKSAAASGTFNGFNWYSQKPLQTMEDWDTKTLQVISDKSSVETNLTKSMQFYSNPSKTVLVAYYPVAKKVFICYTVSGFAKTLKLRLENPLLSVDFEVNNVYFTDTTKHVTVKTLT